MLQFLFLYLQGRFISQPQEHIFSANMFSCVMFKQVCEWLGLCSREYHKRYFNQRIFRFALHPDLETQRKNQVYRLYTAGNFNPRICTETPEERESTMKKSPELKSHDENLSQSTPRVWDDTSVFTGNVRGTKESEYSASVTVEASTDMHVNGEGKSILLLKLNPESSDDGQRDGVPDDELLLANGLLTNNDQLEKSPCTAAKPSRVRSFMRYPCLTTNGNSSLREQRILKMLQVCFMDPLAIFMCSLLLGSLLELILAKFFLCAGGKVTHKGRLTQTS